MGISYFEVWKKRMENNGGNITQSRINTSKDFFNRNFTEDPSYKLATLKKKDIIIDDSDLDTRIVNVDTDVYKKKIYVRPDTNIEAGDYIIYSNKTYLALSVEDNLISPCANSTFCNYTLKWMINGEYFETQAIVTNNTKYTLGITNLSTGFTEGSGMFGVIVSYNEKTKKIPLGERFIVNGQAWEATQLDHSSVPNVLSILLGESSKSTEFDDIDNEIADAFLYNYAIALNSNTESIQVDETFQVVANVTNNSVIVSNPSVMWKSSDETIATVDNNGLITGLTVGNCIIMAIIGSVSTTLSLDVITKSVTPVISYGHNFSQGTSIKQYVTSILTCTETTDSVTTPLNISYSWDSVGQSLISSKKIIITTKSSSSIGIKNALITSSTVAHLTVKDIDTGTLILDNEPITFIKGI